MHIIVESVCIALKKHPIPYLFAFLVTSSLPACGVLQLFFYYTSTVVSHETQQAQFFLPLVTCHIWNKTLILPNSSCYLEKQLRDEEHYSALTHSLTATYRCSAVAIDTVPSLPLRRSPFSVGMEGVEENRGEVAVAAASASYSYQCSWELPSLLLSSFTFLPTFPPSFSSSNLHTARSPPAPPPLFPFVSHNCICFSLTLCPSPLFSSVWLTQADFFERGCRRKRTTKVSAETRLFNTVCEKVRAEKTRGGKGVEH